MSLHNPLNVYSGEDSVQKYFDPDVQPPLPLVEIPNELNPFKQDGVRIYAKMMTVLPCHNVKALPAMNLLSNSVKPGRTKTIIEYSSGSTVISMSMVSRVFHGIDDTRAYLSNKTSDAKLKLMQFFGLNLTLFGGPSQPEPRDPRGGIEKARVQAATEECVANPNQYESDENWEAHYKWTGPQILRQLPEINLICAGMGTSGTMTGLGTYMHDAKSSCFRLGVCTAAGQRVPGPRSYALMAPVQFPWRAAIDGLEEVGEVDSYALSMQLSRFGLICGPSSGFNLQGLYQHLEKRKAAGTLDSLRNSDGQIHCVFLCCDLPYQYISEYFEKLDDSWFPEIRNHHLTKVDKYRYDEAWERLPASVVPDFFATEMPVSLHSNSPAIELRPDSIVLDFRQEHDFQTGHLPGAISIPLDSLPTGTTSPFDDSELLSQQWTELEAMFSTKGTNLAPSAVDRLKGKHILTICYNGDTSRIANSVLRAKGIESQSCRGGFTAVQQWLESCLNLPDSPRIPLEKCEAAVGIAEVSEPLHVR